LEFLWLFSALLTLNPNTKPNSDCWKLKLLKQPKKRLQKKVKKVRRRRLMTRLKAKNNRKTKAVKRIKIKSKVQLKSSSFMAKSF